MIRFRIVVSVVGIIVQGFAALMLIPLLSALLSGQYDSAGMFVLCSLIGFILGQLAWRCHREKNFDDLTRVEGMGAVAFSWLSVALVGAIPYLGFGIGFIDSLFESMSGFTTTGATILKDFAILNSSMFFYRGYTQWLNSAACSGSRGKWFKSTDFRYMLISILIVVAIASDEAA